MYLEGIWLASLQLKDECDVQLAARMSGQLLKAHEADESSLKTLKSTIKAAEILVPHGC